MAEPPSFGSRYEVVRRVSDGGRASVFHAIDRVHGWAVALKAYPVGDGDRDDLLAEAHVLMSLSPHAGLPVVCNDFFTDDDRHYVLAIKWVDGTDLQHVLDDEVDAGDALSYPTVIDIAERLAEALDHLHAHDPPVVHGDVKPANVVRTPAGAIVLVDFDIASAHVGRGRIGTEGFVAPEVAAGDKPSPAADVYGLAATVVALLTGAPPDGAEPQLPRLDLAVRSKVVGALRKALSNDPEQRHRSAGKFAAALREAARPVLPTGVVALLATEVVGAGRLWEADPEEMRTALGRLRDIRDVVVDSFGGHVVTSTNEADRTLIVFQNASSAALAAIDLHAQARATRFPQGFELRQRAALAVGEAALNGGVYTGAVVDQVLRLRSVAGPDTTLAPETTAEMLLGLVGDQVSIVPIGPAVDAELPAGMPLFAVTPSGHEHEASLRVAKPAPPEPTVVETGSAAPGEVDRLAIARTALQHTNTLAAFTVCGLAVIYRVVLSPELGAAALATALAAVAGLLAVVFAARVYTVETRRRRQEIDEVAHEEAERVRSEASERERVDARRRLDSGFAQLSTPDADHARRVLHDLSDESDLVRAAMLRGDRRWTGGVIAQLSGLVEDTHRRGMSALSDALELMEASAGPRRDRLADDVEAIEERLAQPGLPAAERERDEQRLASARRRGERLHGSLERARELIFEAERCADAISEARIELAAARADDTQAVVGSVVESLEETIRRVRRVQDEVRRLGR